MPECLPVAEGDIMKQYSDATWQRALKSFGPGRAPDACGWTQEVFLALSLHPRIQKIMRQVATGILVNQWSTAFLDLLTTGRVIAIYKNKSGHLRPITVPSVWRKLVGAWTTQSWFSPLKECVGSSQYGVGCPNGTILMAQDVTDDLDAHEGWAAVHLDIRAAFTNVRHLSLISALEQIAPPLLMAQSHWNRRPTPFFLQASNGSQEMHYAEVGVPQGDPFSSWAFAVTLQLAQREFGELMGAQGLRDGQDYQCRAYVDDVVLTGARDLLPAMVVALEQALATIGLQLQREKMQVYSPGSDPNELAEAFGCEPAACSGDGMINCGLALRHDVEEHLLDKPDIAIGSAAYQRKFLQRKLEALQARCRALHVIAQDMTSHGLHVSIQLLHSSLLASCVYLLRGMNVEVSCPWAAQCDSLFQQTWLQLMQICALSPAQCVMVTASPAMGGLGLQRLKMDAPLHALSQALAIRALRHSQLQSQGSWSPTEQRAWDKCSEMLDVEKALGKSQTVLQAEGDTKTMRKLRMACPSAEGVLPGDISSRLCVVTSGPEPQLELNERQKRAASTVWYSQPSGHFLTNDVLIAGVRDRLELPQDPQNMMCQYTSRTSMRLCSTPLDLQGEHCNKCCQALVQARHHLIRDWIKTKLNEYGEHASTEQSV